MEITLKFKKCFKELEVATFDSVRVPLAKPVWVDFPAAEFLSGSRDALVRLLDRGIMFVAKQGETIISNDRDMRNLYRKKGHKAVGIDRIVPSASSVASVGLYP